MAAVRSLGVHTPSGLPYLVAEGFLPDDPAEDSYTWETYNESHGHEEVLATESCVAWSQGGVVRKVFSFDAEKQKVQQAVLTWFPSDEDSESRHQELGKLDHHDSSFHKPRKRRKLSSDFSSNKASSQSSTKLSRALVVFLRYQAHVYFLSGATHVLDLHFEVERAFPAPRGLILQRKLPIDADETLPTPVPPAPPNSFFSSFAVRQSQQQSSFQIKADESTKLDFGLLKRSKAPATDTLPRHFCLTNPLSELGLVVHARSDLHQSISRSYGAPAPDLESLDKKEEILHVSTASELAEDEGLEPSLTLIVSANNERRMYSIWQAFYTDSKPVASLFVGHKASSSGAKSRRRSSFVTNTGATTPALRGGENLRESVGPAKRGKKVPALSASQSTALSEASAEDLMASQLDPDFDTRQPAKESRRVSSLLSRTDLSTNFDRNAFQELASQRTTARTSFGPNSRRGQSLGGPNDRTSFGIGSQRKIRASTPGAFSRLSIDDASEIGTSVTLDGDDSVMIDELDEFEDIFASHAELDAFDFQQPFGGLRKEVLIHKFAEIPMSESVPLRYSFGSTSQDSFSLNIRVFTTSSPKMAAEPGHYGRRFFLHIMNRDTKDLVQVEYAVHRGKEMPSLSTLYGAPNLSAAIARVVPIAICKKVSRFKGHSDAMKISDDRISRIICLEENDGRSSLRLYAPWSPESTHYLSLHRLRIFSPFDIASGPTSSPRSVGKQRTLLPPKLMTELLHPGQDGTLSLRDVEHQIHRVQIQLRAYNDFVAKILDLSLFILPSWTGDFLLSLWWARYQACHSEEQKEWSALVEAIFALALALDEGTGKRRKPEVVSTLTKGHSRSSQGSGTDCFTLMLGLETPWNSQKAWTLPAWSWAVPPPETYASSKQRVHKNSHILAVREFLRSKQGQEVVGPLRSNPDLTRLAVSRILAVLHLLCEETKLDMSMPGLNDPKKGKLCAVLAQLGRWMGWSKWDWKHGHYYCSEMAGATTFEFDDVTIRAYVSSDYPFSTQAPPSIYAWLEQALAPDHFVPFPSLDAVLQVSSSRSLQHTSKHFFPRTSALSKYLTALNALESLPEKQVEAIADAGISPRMLDTFPEAVLAILKDGIVKCQSNPPTTWTSSFLELVGREDLVMLADGGSADPQDAIPPSVSLSDFLLCIILALTYLSTSLPIITHDVHTVCQATETPSPVFSNPEFDRFSVSRLIFSEDRRYVEALHIIEPLRTAVAECIPDPSWSEAQLLDAQKEVVQWVMVRTFALAPGQAMARYDSRRPVLTEKYAIHGYSTLCIMKPMGNTVSADRTSFTEERYGWAWFHAGVAAGLQICRHAEGIDTSWIVFNKPADLNMRHAGLLLALGLNGHLKNIAKWLCFKYLTPKHTMTSIGLLLGLSASQLGTMDTLVTRLLSVHVTRMLPPGAAELNLSPLTQTAGLMGIGLLYYNTQHRRMSEIMLSEIENLEVDDPAGAPDALRDESYRLAAGFALGYINLGQGNDLKGLQDMRIVERLLAVAVGARPVDLVHILDQATSGATVAIALIFMKTGNKAVARKVDVPDTLPQFDYVRPDVLLTRTLAKHLILWDDIKVEHRWIINNLPPEYAKDYHLRDIKALRSEHMPFYNILAGLLWSIGLRYAGSGNVKVRDFLIKYLDGFIRLCRLPALRYDAKLARNTVRNCQDLVALSCATVMAGTGDIDVMRRLRLLHGRANADTPYGSHLAIHMALGALFLGGGSMTFGTSNLAIASLICAFYPLFPMDVTDNKAHLQPFRHMWVLATDSRCVVTRDVDTNRAIRVPLTLTLRDGTTQKLTAPCLLPGLESVGRIETSGREYWPITLDFANNPNHLAAFKSNQTLHVRRRPASQAYSNVFSTTLVSLNDSHSKSLIGARKVFGSIFRLPMFRDLSFELSDVGLVLPVDERSSMWLDSRGSVVDDKLTLTKSAARGTDRDMLWNLRLLFKWAEWAAEKGGGGVRWLGKDVIESLRGAIEERARRQQEEG